MQHTTSQTLLSSTEHGPQAHHFPAWAAQRVLEHAIHNIANFTISLQNTGPKRIISQHGLLTTVCYKLGADIPPCYALEGATICVCTRVCVCVCVCLCVRACVYVCV